MRVYMPEYACMFGSRARDCAPRRAASGELAVPTAPRCSGYTDLEAAGSSRPKSLFEVVSTRELPGGMSSRVASLFGCARGPRIWSCVVQECAAARPFYSCLFARCLSVQLHAGGSKQPRYAGLTLTQPPPRRRTGSRRRARGAPTTAGVASRGAAAIGRPGTVAAAIARARRPERQGLLRRRPSRQRRMRAARRRRRRPCGPAR